MRERGSGSCSGSSISSSSGSIGSCGGRWRRRHRRVAAVLLFSPLFPIHLKRKCLSLFYSLLSLRQKRKTFFFSGFFCCSPRVHARRAGGDIAFWFLFNRTRRARAAGVAFFKTMDSGRSFFEKCLGFVSKKLGKKLCLTLSSHNTFARARTERNTDRKKGRQTRNRKQKITHRALFAFLRDYIPFLLEWSIHTALVHS